MKSNAPKILTLTLRFECYFWITLRQLQSETITCFQVTSLNSSWFWLGDDAFFFLLLVVSQNYITRVIDEDILVGNSALLKCLIPSFVADFITVHSWVDSTQVVLTPNPNYGTVFAFWCRRLWTC